MVKEILQNETGPRYKWAGGPDDYKTFNDIVSLIKQYDFTTNRIESYPQQLAKEDKNRKIFKELQKKGVTAITDGTYQVPYKGIDKAKDIDIKFVGK